jgi:hypothetical protein
MSISINRPAIQAADLQAMSVLVVGAQPRDLPGVACHADPAAPALMLAIAGPIEGSELAAVLEIVGDPALPIADFAGLSGIRNDYRATGLNPRSCAEAWSFVAPIRRRLAELPFVAPRNERREMTVLRLAWSRDLPVQAAFNANAKHLVAYPLLGEDADNRERLDRLAAMELLARRHFTRTSLCVRCASARLLAYEACPACGGSDLADEKLVHHYRCGWQAPESAFIRGRQLVCPKCRRELRNFGTDYGKPGVIVHCRTCGASNPDPDLRYACLDCTLVMPSDKAPSADWFHYHLTDQGMRALRDGRFAVRTIDAGLAPRSAARSIIEFKLLASAAQRSAHRFGRAFSVAELVSPNLTALRAAHGSESLDAALRHAVTVVMQTVSDCEMVAVTADDGLLIGFPETDAAEAAVITETVRAAIAEAVPLPLNFVATLHDGETVVELLARS